MDIIASIAILTARMYDLLYPFNLVNFKRIITKNVIENAITVPRSNLNPIILRIIGTNPSGVIEDNWEIPILSG